MTGKVRIIGGTWRGRKLEVPNLPGLRPSGDRVREVLFNWLQAHIAGRQVLDLFAGTGALGLEAASRSADGVVLVEQDRSLCRALQAIQQAWPGGERLQVLHQDAVAFLETDSVKAFDLVFVDPPFDAELYKPTIQRLLDRSWLNPDALLYVEHAANLDPFDRHGFTGLSPLRDKTIGEVRLRLFRHKQQTE